MVMAFSVVYAEIIQPTVWARLVTQPSPPHSESSIHVTFPRRFGGRTSGLNGPYTLVIDLLAVTLLVSSSAVVQFPERYISAAGFDVDCAPHINTT